MIADVYRKENFPEIAEWFRAHRMDVPPKWSLSDTGAIVSGAACGFLYVTNSGVGYLDLFISNPRIKKKERAEALDLVVERLISMAIDTNIKLLCCGSKLQSVSDLAMRHDFIKTGQHLSFARKI